MSVAGSPAYMSPELMSGPQDREVAAEEEEKTGYACDVWSLGASTCFFFYSGWMLTRFDAGVTLYALVVGCLPFKASDPTELFRAIREAECVVPSLSLFDRYSPFPPSQTRVPSHPFPRTPPPSPLPTIQVARSTPLNPLSLDRLLAHRLWDLPPPTLRRQRCDRHRRTLRRRSRPRAGSLPRLDIPRPLCRSKVQGPPHKRRPSSSEPSELELVPDFFTRPHSLRYRCRLAGNGRFASNLPSPRRDVRSQ